MTISAKDIALISASIEAAKKEGRCSRAIISPATFEELEPIFASMHVTLKRTAKPWVYNAHWSNKPPVKLVATSGCFDIIHAGHVALFAEMRKLTGPKGMVVVLLNSDEYLRRKKGEHRPVQCLEHRIQVLRAMRNVDIVVPFHDDDPCRLIRIMQPDIWVKGIEYRDKGIPEEAAMAAVGGTVTYVDTGVVAHTSTILSKIERQYDEKR